jgi:hypothetical protein
MSIKQLIAIELTALGNLADFKLGCLKKNLENMILVLIHLHSSVLLVAMSDK